MAQMSEQMQNIYKRSQSMIFVWHAFLTVNYYSAVGLFGAPKDLSWI